MNRNHTHTAPGYRPEIDGLRAVAVILVIIYHAKFSITGKDILTGGFIGVDIFFVISGYLISRLIISEYTKTAAFSFKNFYIKRIRRILPALLTVLIASLPFAWILLLPTDFIDYAKSFIASLFFGSNIYFYFATTEYGADSSLLKPLLHTWSLGIEEQYYILFPALFIPMLKASRRRALLITYALIVISLITAQVLSQSNPDLNFYLLPSRGWELLTGTVLAIWEKENRLSNVPQALRNILPTVGLTLVIIAAVLFNKITPHPSLWTLAPVIGVMLIIALSHKGEPLGRLLSSTLFVHIGLLSYSLYLWHFPILAFARIKNGTLSNPEKLLCIAVTYIAALITYKLIETPFRKRTIVSNKKALPFILATFLASTAAAGTIVQQEGFKSRVPSIFTAEDFTQKPWHTLKASNGKPCYDRKENFCIFNKGIGKKTVVLIGDSHGGAISGNLQNRLGDQFNYIDLTYSACWPLEGFTQVNYKGTVLENCNADYQKKRLDVISNYKDAIIVVIGRLPLYLSSWHFDNQEGGVEGTLFRTFFHEEDDTITLETGVKQTLEKLLNAGNDVVLVYPLVEAGWNIPKKLMAEKPTGLLDMNNYLRENPITISYDVYKERSKKSFDLLNSIKHDRLYRVYPHELLCNTTIQGRCLTHDENHIFYADDDHPSHKGSEMINDLIISKIQEIGVLD